MWAASELVTLEKAADKFDRDVAAGIVRGLVEHLEQGGVAPSESEQRTLMKQLRRARWFELMRDAAEALTAVGQAVPTARRQHGQALIELGRFDDAIAVLEALVADAGCPASEQTEARGLIGRIYKQLYVNGSAGVMRRATLSSSISTYYEAYAANRTENTWHGINAVALLLRGRRDGIEINGAEEPKRMAEAIRVTAASGPYHWDLATAAEACIALGKWDDAFTYLEKYVQHSDVDAFSCASTLRQLKEVWQIREDGPGGKLITLLQAAVLRGAQGSKEAPEAIGAPLPLGIGELGTALATAADAERRGALEKVFGANGPRSIEWYGRGLARARGVGRVESAAGRPVGSGFVLRAGTLFANTSRPDEMLFVTNAHVLGETDSEALRPKDAVVRFEAVDTSRTLGVREILFESGKGQLDVTVVRLDAAITGVEPYPLSPRQEPVYDAAHARQLYAIGHPRGGGLSISLDDNLQVGWKLPKLHYRTPTEPGSSGSPVFDDAWRLIAVHHSGSGAMQRLDGQPGTYSANEGIWIHTVVDAIAQLAAATDKLESSAAPVVRPAFRRSLFISYAHEDKPWLDRLQKHLAPLARHAKIECWDDQKLQAGSSWLGEIDRQLDEASVAILLVSADFLASEFITHHEFPKLLEASTRRGLTIIPIAVGPSSFKHVPELASLQFANDPQRPLTRMKKPDAEDALVEIVETIGNHVSRTQLLNSLGTMDAMAFQATGLGGTAPAERGNAALGARALQVESDVVIATAGGRRAVVRWNEIESLAPQARQMILTYDTAICELYDRWTEHHQKSIARDPDVRRRALQELDGIRTDLCGQFNSLLDFFQHCGWSLEDHYHGVRFLCAQGRQ